MESRKPPPLPPRAVAKEQSNPALSKSPPKARVEQRAMEAFQGAVTPDAPLRLPEVDPVDEAEIAQVMESIPKLFAEKAAAAISKVEVGSVFAYPEGNGELVLLVRVDTGVDVKVVDNTEAGRQVV